jgi:hypothetical protein
MAERPPTTDLRGGKASDDSFTILMANLVVEYAVDFQVDVFSCAAAGSTVLFEDPKSLGTERVGSSMLRGGSSGDSSEMQMFPYRWISDHERSEGWVLAKLRVRSEDLESIPCQDVASATRGLLCLGSR